MKSLALGIFPATLALCLSPKAWTREMRSFGAVCIGMPFPAELGATTMFELEDDSTWYVVTFDRALLKSPLVDRVAVVAHEATHVWQYLLELVDEDKAGDELEAYAVQWITKWILQQLEDAGWLR